MPTLPELLLDPKHRDAIIADCVARVEAQAASAGGLKGVGLRTALATVKKARPDIVPKAVARLLPEFASALDPLFTRFKQQRPSGENDFGRFLKQHSAEARDALMRIADERADASTHQALRSAYRKLRGILAAELEAMLPGLVKGLSARMARE